jgi:cell division septal protein FtsQ
MRYKIATLCVIFLSVFFVKDKENFFFSDFKINNVDVTGYSAFSRDDIKHKIDANNLHQKNLLFFDIWKLYEDLKSISLVEKVVVRKIYPNNLSIEVRERSPVALIVDNKKNYIFDKSDKIIPIDHNMMKKFNFFKDLFYIEGDNILSEVSFLVDIFVDKDFSKRISGLYKIGDRRWNMIVDKKIKVMLPERINKDLVISIFNTVDQMKSKNNIKMQAVYTILDARMKDKIFIKNIGE